MAGLIRREVLWTGSVGEFGMDEVELPTGRVATLPLLRHPGAAAVVPFVDADTILLLHQHRHAAGGAIWEIPAGKLEASEAPELCARRELEEETGYAPGRLERTGEVLTAPGFTDEVIALFCAWDLVEGRPDHQANEVIEVHPVRFETALEMIDRGDIRDAKSIAGLFHAARRR